MADKTKVTRIKATDTTPKNTKQSKAAVKSATKSKLRVKKASAPNADAADVKKNIFARIAGYFKGAWYELKQVRWPTRKATWSLTLAVLLFSLFFVVLILLLDSLFQYLFQLIIS